MHRWSVHADLRRTLRELAAAGLDLLLPPTCPGCGVPARGLCRPCRAHLLDRPAPSCARCGEALVVEDAPCTADHRPLRGLRWAHAPYRYAGTGGALVRRLKFAGDGGALLHLARALEACAAGRLRGAFRRALVVPVPLHKTRRRARGLDQAALLALATGERLRLPVATGVLARVRATLPQGDPRVTSRTGNVAGAFAVRRPSAIGGRTVVLVDDVFTSGATLRECAGLLREAGAREVAALTACRS